MIPSLCCHCIAEGRVVLSPVDDSFPVHGGARTMCDGNTLCITHCLNYMTMKAQQKKERDAQMAALMAAADKD